MVHVHVSFFWSHPQMCTVGEKYLFLGSRLGNSLLLKITRISKEGLPFTVAINIYICVCMYACMYMYIHGSVCESFTIGGLREKRSGRIARQVVQAMATFSCAKHRSSFVLLSRWLHNLPVMMVSFISHWHSMS